MRNGAVGAPATSGNSLPVKGKKWCHTDRLLGKNSLKEGAMWHIWSKQGIVNQEETGISREKHGKTRESVFSMQSSRRSHSNRYARSNTGTV
jgi:hypothetical protein